MRVWRTQNIIWSNFLITVCDYYYSQDYVIMSSDRLSCFERNIKTRKGRATTIILWTHNNILERVRPADVTTRNEELATFTKIIWQGIILLCVTPSHSHTTEERTGKTKRFKTTAKRLFKAMIPNTWWVCHGGAERLKVASANKQILRHMYDEWVLRLLNNTTTIKAVQVNKFFFARHVEWLKCAYYIFRSVCLS